MSDKIIQGLHDIVINTCNHLFSNRQLITNKVIKNILLKNGDWSEQEIDGCLSEYINEWRLANLIERDIDQELLSAQRTIIQLRTALAAEKNKYKLYKVKIIQELRNILRKPS